VRFSPRQSRRPGDRTLNLASMIDVTFLLLMYFMVTVVVMANEDFLSPTLQTESKSSTDAASDFQTQEVEVLAIDGRPAYRLGSRIVHDRAGLRDRLERLPKSVGLLVRVSDGINVEFAVAAIQVARDVGFDQVTYVPVP
jgi:biopolymer transport protein ExbD